MGVHGVCPELVNLFDYMVEQIPGGSKGVTLERVQGYASNMQDTLEELIDLFGPTTKLCEIENSDEIEGLLW